MRRFSFSTPTGLVLVGLMLAGCATSRPVSPPSAARDTPDHFLVGTHTDASTSEPQGGPACQNPMVDPRDGTRLMLVRAAEGQGDYTVPEGRYGVTRGYVLRLDCATGRPVGVVRR